MSAVIPTVEWKDGVVRLLDQSQLPGRVEILECRDVESVVSAIRSLRVRDAPAIGVTAAMGIALGSQTILENEASAFTRKLFAVCRQFAQSNLFIVVAMAPALLIETCLMQVMVQLGPGEVAIMKEVEVAVFNSDHH